MLNKKLWYIAHLLNVWLRQRNRKKNASWKVCRWEYDYLEQVKVQHLWRTKHLWGRKRARCCCTVTSALPPRQHVALLFVHGGAQRDVSGFVFSVTSVLAIFVASHEANEHICETLAHKESSIHVSLQMTHKSVSVWVMEVPAKVFVSLFAFCSFCSSKQTCFIGIYVTEWATLSIEIEFRLKLWLGHSTLWFKLTVCLGFLSCWEVNLMNPVSLF